VDRWPDDVRELVEGHPAVHVQAPALNLLHQLILALLGPIYERFCCFRIRQQHCVQHRA
jgi:hypothetical protein